MPPRREPRRWLQRQDNRQFVEHNDEHDLVDHDHQLVDLAGLGGMFTTLPTAGPSSTSSRV